MSILAVTLPTQRDANYKYPANLIPNLQVLPLFLPNANIIRNIAA